MKIDPNINFEQFSAEMQHRVVKYPLHSLAVREALKFARKHKDPDFYRIAANKVHSQRQFQRELYGPSKWERFVDYFSLGSLREVVVMLVLVVAGIMGIEATQGLFSTASSSASFENMDVDELARRLGFVLDAQQIERQAETAPAAALDSHEIGSSESAKSSSRLSDDEIQRIASAVIQELQMKEAAPTAPAKREQTPLSQDTLDNKPDPVTLTQATQE